MIDLTTFGDLADGVLTLHPIFTAGHFEGLQLTGLNVFPVEQHLIIDGSGVTQCDSVGVAALLWLVQQASAGGVNLEWRSLPTVISHLLELYELDLAGITDYARRLN